MSGLNPSQTSAVNHREGPLLVLAGAGTGKTRVITFRIAKLIQQGVPPERILGVTFTNKAANEMQERLGKLLKLKSKNRPLISTFHSYCVRVLRRHIERLGYPLRFAIYSGGDQESLARTVLREINVADTVLSPSQLLFHISGWKNKGLTPQQAQLDADNDQATLAAIGFRRYQSALKRLGAVDFDDLLNLTVKLFTQFPDCRAEEAARFDQILIDEYQDTNNVQYAIVKALASQHRNLCVVGDDDQSIYGWRGAQVEHILNFHHDWPGAKIVRLVDNYRSTQAILNVANSLIEHNRLRHGKVLQADRPGGPVPTFVQFADENKEAESVVLSIQSRMSIERREPRDFAILFRTNEQTRVFETALRRAKVPYVLIGGMSFFDRKEVQDIICYLRLLSELPDDTSILRILNRPPRGLGKKAIDRLIASSLQKKCSIWNLLNDANLKPNLGASAEAGLDELLNVTVDLHQKIKAGIPLVDVAMELVDRVGYRREIERLYTEPEDQESRWNAVRQVIDALGSYVKDAKEPSLEEFLDQILLGDRDVDNEKDKQLRKNAVFLMTVHASKGLEFPEVYLVGMEEGILPHHRSTGEDDSGIDEERRLCYVAVTRAQDNLTLSMSLTRMKWGKAQQRHPSRFLYELFGKTDHPNYEKAKQASGR